MQHKHLKNTNEFKTVFKFKWIIYTWLYISLRFFSVVRIFALPLSTLLTFEQMSLSLLLSSWLFTSALPCFYWIWVCTTQAWDWTPEIKMSSHKLLCHKKNFVLNVVILTINMRSLVRMINNANSSPQQFRQKNSHYHFLTFSNRIVVKGDTVLADYKSELKHYVKSTNLNVDMTTPLLKMNSFVQQNWVVSSICFRYGWMKLKAWSTLKMIHRRCTINVWELVAMMSRVAYVTARVWQVGYSFI